MSRPEGVKRALERASRADLIIWLTSVEDESDNQVLVVDQQQSIADEQDGQIVADDEKASQPQLLAPRVIDERTAYIMNSMLRDVITQGTGRRALALERNDLAGKTGTTNGPIDAWFSGYNHHLMATAWVGFDNNQNLGRREYGGSAALPIWMDYMEVALEGVPEILQPPPDGIVTVRIDPETGERALPGSRDGVFEIFRKENAPDEKAFDGRPDSGDYEDVIPENIWTN